MKKILAVAMAALMVLSLAACGESQPAATEAAAEAKVEGAADAAEASTEAPYVIMVNALNGHPVYEQQAAGARKAAEDYGVNLEIIGPSMGSAAIVTDTIAAMENATTLAPDAIICEPDDPSYFTSVSKMKEAGIPVFCTSTGPDNQDDYVSCSGTDNVQYGRTAADMIAEASGGEAHILCILAELTTINQVKQLEGLKERIAEAYPNMEVVEAVADSCDLSKAVSECQDNFNAYPQIDTVVMFESTGGPGVAQVAKEMGRDIRILDIDAVEETIDNIKNGSEWATLAQNFYKRGYESVRMAYEYVTQNGQVEYPQFVDSGTVLITKETADTYEEDLWAAVKMKGQPW